MPRPGRPPKGSRAYHRARRRFLQSRQKQQQMQTYYDDQGDDQGDEYADDDEFSQDQYGAYGVVPALAIATIILVDGYVFAKGFGLIPPTRKQLQRRVKRIRKRIRKRKSKGRNTLRLKGRLYNLKRAIRMMKKYGDKKGWKKFKGQKKWEQKNPRKAKARWVKRIAARRAAREGSTSGWGLAQPRAPTIGLRTMVPAGATPSLSVQNRILNAYERKYLQARGQAVANMRLGRWRYVAIWQKYIHTIQIRQINAARRWNRKARLALYIRRLQTSPYRHFGPARTPYAPYSYTYPQRRYRQAPTRGAQQNYLVAAGLAGMGSLEIATGLGGIV
jgi:hypothetical protein